MVVLLLVGVLGDRLFYCFEIRGELRDMVWVLKVFIIKRFRVFGIIELTFWREMKGIFFFCFFEYGFLVEKFGGYVVVRFGASFSVFIFCLRYFFYFFGFR